jgi:quercetin dioxygenase-like cupin family protein
MKITKVSEAPIHQNPHGVDARKLHDSEHAQVVVITLQPGQELKRHITPVDALFFVLEGTGIVEVNTLIDSPAGIPHCWYNRSDAVLRVLVVKAPRQEGPSKIL